MSANRLSNRQELALTGLLIGKRLDVVARDVGIAPSTLRRWRRLPAVQRALEEAFRTHHEMTLIRLVEIATSSVTVLGELMLPGNLPLVRLKAAATVLSHAIAAMDRLGQPERLMPLDALVMGNNGHVLDVADNLVGHD
ncbi:MAG TPA: hypothetical protein VFA32_12730 [Dehalococcoidia bacterium]|nr:hypothetical protein [Dehalococcoidia bacterium]